MSNESNRRPASLKRALGKGFREAYDRLGYVVASNLLWFAAVAAVYGGMVLVAGALPGLANVVKLLLMLPVGLVGYFGALGVYYYANQVVFRKDPSAIDTFAGIRLLFWPGLKLFCADAVITAVLVVDTVFFLGMMDRGLAFVGLAVFSLYVTLMWLMVWMYHLPLLAAQLESESGTGVLVVLRKSVLLVLDNPGFTVGLFIVIIAITILAVLPAMAGMALFFLGVTAFVITHAVRELFTKYGLVEPDPEIVDDGGWGRG